MRNEMNPFCHLSVGFIKRSCGKAEVPRLLACFLDDILSQRRGNTHVERKNPIFFLFDFPQIFMNPNLTFSFSERLMGMRR